MFDAKMHFRELLERAQAQKATVALHLRSGTILTGQVGSVGDHHVVLTQLTGKEFYDAQILIEDISAVEARARGK